MGYEEADLLDGSVAGRLHRWARRRDRLVDTPRGAASVPQPAGARDGRASLRTAPVRGDDRLGDGRRETVDLGARARVRPHLEDTPKIVFSKTLEKVEGNAILV